jgi:hypothetical protein
MLVIVSVALVVMSLVVGGHVHPEGGSEWPAAVAWRWTGGPARWRWRRVALIALGVVAVAAALAGIAIHHALAHMFDGADLSRLTIFHGC